ncbi:hypothetical protein CRG98_016605 [Punica granatum]|uniref:Carboxypeptidase n=1 Tax=Punica granatum TaxID=22663 RepID=A0A2I0K5G7_PUNGR|nr:hypothetical protein CRG98_016605 [Punica granatum]
MEQIRSKERILFLPILLSVFLLVVGNCKSHGIRNQAAVLGSFYKAKLFDKSKGSNIDTSDFKLATSDLAVVGDADAVDLLELMGPFDNAGLKENDRIGRLPGQPPVQFNQYGGYVTIDASKGRAFFYYFVEAENSKDSLPLLLWLNGVANVLFLESPTGVGFSYSNTSSDYATNGDRKTASDNYKFLVNWFKRFPEYRGRDFYISGESYAGHYVPQLAHHILALNKRVTKNNIINLKGIIIGNAVTNDVTDNIGMYDFFATHALVSDETVQDIKKYCDFSPNASDDESSDQCIAASNQAGLDVSGIDIYGIYGPLCHNSNLTSKPNKASVMKYEPCSDYYVYAYLNLPEVQEALHANVTKLKYDWQPCSNVITKWGDSPSTVIPLLQEFMAGGLRVWVFSGDTDGRVPVTSTKYSINKMNLTVKTAWHPWYMAGEVGGYTQVYKGDFTFATVRAAGHQVPSYEPQRALSLMTHFLSGTPLPNTTRFLRS